MNTLNKIFAICFTLVGICFVTLIIFTTYVAIKNLLK